MSSLLNNASLLLNPAGSIIAYEEDKILSVLPRNGTGDFTFSGGDGGTRVNQDGYIEPTPANIFTYSEQFNNWNIRSGTTITSNYSTSPDGKNNATRVQRTSDDGYIWEDNFRLQSNTTYTISVYAKSSSGTIQFNGYWGTAASSSAVIPLTSEWVRYSYTFNTINVINNGDYGFYLPNSDSQIWGAMINVGLTARPYQPTTDRLNYPRITYQNGRGALLSEPQRTNLWLQSQNFSNAGVTYSLFRLTLTQNAGISPDGTSNAVKWVDTATTGQHQLEPFFTAVSGQTYTVSVFVKAAERTQFHIFAFADNGVFNNTDAFYDVAAGTVISGTGASIEKWPNGWYRCIRTMTAGASGTGYWGVGPAVNGAASYVGDTNSGILVWGGQNEAGSFPTSYIPTTSATVTRPLDQYSVTNLESKGLTGTNVGTLYLSVANTANSYDGGAINAKVGGGGNFPFNYMILDSTGTNNRVRIFNGGAQTAAYTFTETFAKMAVTADGTNSSVFVNGIKKGTSSGLLAGIEEITQEAIGTGLRYTTATYTTALSDAQCQELTTVRSGSGGNISYYGPYTIHTFTGSATFTPSFNGEVEVLVVAGGGGGGSAADSFYEAGGGGGAGGLLYTSAYGVSAGTGITVTIGAGGVGGLNHTATSPSNRSGNGSNSVFGGLSAIGGGGGGGAYYAATNGGSGGAGDGWYSNSVGVPYGNGITGQGNRGGAGNGFISTSGAGGGGGGAGTIGNNGLGSGNLTGGAGGNGLPYSISGFSTYYAGGGGGKTAVVGSGAGGAGGLGGGGNGGVAGGIALGTAGTNYTGGGGGGGLSTSTATGAGGAGVVIVRYLT